MNQINLQNRLEVSKGTIKNEPNNAMQPASQTTENGQAEKKSPLNCIGLFAILAVGVDAAASFLKAKMERAAAVAAQVGAAVLKSKKAVSAAATAVLVRIRPEPPKKARLVVSTPILALLAGIFAVQPQAMASRGILAVPAPTYLEVSGYISYTTRYRRTYQHRTEYERKYSMVLAPSSGLLVRAFKEWGQGTSHWTRIESYYYRGRVVSYKLQRDPNSHRGRGLLSGITYARAPVYWHFKEGGIRCLSKRWL